MNYTHNNLQERIFYTIDCDNAQQHFIKIKVQFPVDENKTIIHLPSWRPGRYELGNFAKNIKNFKEKHIFFQNKGEHYYYYLAYFMEIYYENPNKNRGLLLKMVNFWDDILSIDIAKTKSEHDLLCEIYKIMDKYFVNNY